MRNFTDYKENWIDAIISSHMEIISKEILKKIKKIDSIILVGGFGRGEGTIKIVGKNKLIPLKDYDIIVVTNSNISEKKYISLIQNIHNALKIPSNWYKGAAPGQFHINIKLVKMKNLKRLPPDLSNYEIKVASKILYGTDVRKLIPIQKEDVTYSSGLRVLLNKVIGLLEYLPSNPASYRNNESLKESISYECGKTYIEIGTALTILMGCYEASYKERAKNFEHFFPNILPDLANKSPNLAKQVKKFTNYKLKPDSDKINNDPVELWYSTSGDLLKVIMYYYKKISGINIKNPQNFMEQFFKFLEYYYFYPYIEYYLQRYLWSNRFFTYLASLFIQIYENLRYLRSLSIRKHFYPLTGLFSKRSPVIKIYHAALLTLFSIHYSEYKQKFIENAWSSMKTIYPLNKNKHDLHSKIGLLRNACVEAHKIYNLKKIRKSTF
ncbi:MAG: hypothetical protein ACTSO9_04165 [Candidatus Helarchaeota archaeon]